jgi:peptidylprolyl isomerase
MSNIILLVLCGFTTQAHAKELAANGMDDSHRSLDKMADELVSNFDKLLERTLMVSHLDHRDVDDTTLGKPGQTAVRSCAAPLYSRPAVCRSILCGAKTFSAADWFFASPQRNAKAAEKEEKPSVGERGRQWKPAPSPLVEATVRTGRDKQDQPQSDTASPLGRRHAAGIALGGLVASMVQPTAVRAKTEDIFKEGKKTEGERAIKALKAKEVMQASSSQGAFDAFDAGPLGMRYFDVDVGGGKAPRKGNLVEANYDLRIDGGNFEDIESQKGAVFSVGTGEAFKGFDLAVLGDGKMPAMKEGGMRQVIIPPELAYGDLEVLFRTVRIPPKSTLELTIELVSMNPYAAFDGIG